MCLSLKKKKNNMALTFILRYQIMLNCWQEDPDNRPTFENLRRKLKQMENQHKVKIENLQTG